MMGSPMRNGSPMMNGSPINNPMMINPYMNHMIFDESNDVQSTDEISITWRTCI